MAARGPPLQTDSAAYTAARSSKKTDNVVRKGSRAECDRICGDYASVIVNPARGIKRWFKTCDLKEAARNNTRISWCKGGKDMSFVASKYYDPKIKGYYVKVESRTTLRRNPSLQCKSQGVVKKGALLKLTGYYGFDDVDMQWIGVCYKGKKLYICTTFLEFDENYGIYRDKDGNRVDIYAE